MKIFHFRVINHILPFEDDKKIYIILFNMSTLSTKSHLSFEEDNKIEIVLFSRNYREKIKSIRSQRQSLSKLME